MANPRHVIAFEVDTPAGPLSIAARTDAEAADLRARVRAALAGARDDFADVALPEGTEFQRACWSACRSIPRGETRSYAWLAAAAGSPRAVRAAGQAMRRNPMPVVVPCHRVVGSGGWFGGYAGSARREGPEIATKEWLLDNERSRERVPSAASRPAKD